MSVVDILHPSSLIALQPSTPEDISRWLKPGTIKEIIDGNNNHKIPYDMVLAATARVNERRAGFENVGTFELRRKLVGAVVIERHTIVELLRSSEPQDDRNSSYYVSYNGNHFPFSAPSTEGYPADSSIAAIGLCRLLGNPAKQ